MSRLCRLKSSQNIGDDGLWAYAEITRLRDELEMAEACLAGDNALITGLKDELAESRANDRTTMWYLSGIRNALGFDGDFPALVEYCAALKNQEPFGYFQRNEEWDLSEEIQYEHRNKTDVFPLYTNPVPTDKKLTTDDILNIIKAYADARFLEYKTGDTPLRGCSHTEGMADAADDLFSIILNAKTQAMQERK